MGCCGRSQAHTGSDTATSAGHHSLFAEPLDCTNISPDQGASYNLEWV